MSYVQKNFTASGTEPAGFEEQADGTLLQAVKIDNGQVSITVSLINNIGAEAGSTNLVINATAHGAVVGNLIFDSAGITRGQIRTVKSVTADTITVDRPFLDTPSEGDEFGIYIQTLLQTDVNGVIVFPSTAILVRQGDPWTVQVINSDPISVYDQGVGSSGYVTSVITNTTAAGLAADVGAYLLASVNSKPSIGWVWDGTNFNAFIAEIIP